MLGKIRTRFFYGWVIIIAIMITSFTLMGTRHSFSVFFKPLASEFDLSRAVTSSMFSAYMILCAGVAIIGGWTLDKYGARWVFFLMGLFTGASFLLTSQAGSWWQLFLTYSLLLSIGTGSLFAVGQSIVLRWFDRKRGVAMGITGAGVGIGQMVFPPLAALIISGYGWRVSYLVFGLIVCIVVIPLSRLMRNDPREIGALPDGEVFKTAVTTVEFEEEKTQSAGLSLSQAVRSRNFWVYLPAWLFTGFSNWLVLTHIVPYATDMGVPSVGAATIISVNGIAGMISGIFIGRITDVKGRRIPGIFITLLRGAAIFWLIWAREIWMFYIFAMVFGICQGGLAIVLAAMSGDIFGKRHIGVILGTLTAAFSTGAAIGPLVGGMLYDANGNYTIAFITCSVASILVAVAIASVKTEAKLGNR